MCGRGSKTSRGACSLARSLARSREWLSVATARQATDVFAAPRAMPEELNRTSGSRANTTIEANTTRASARHLCLCGGAAPGGVFEHAAIALPQ